MAEKFTSQASRFGWPLGMALAMALLVTGLTVALAIAMHPFGVPEIVTAIPGAAEPGAEQCYVWDVVNLTGEDADGLNVRLTGVQTITSVYAGEANPFGGPRSGGGYDTPGDSYNFELGVNAVTVAAGESVRVGVCTPDRVGSANMQWLAGADTVGDAVHPVTVTWDWPDSGETQVQVTNTAPTTVTVLSLRLLASETLLSIDELNSAVTANLDAAWSELEEPALLAANGVLSLTLPLAPEGPGSGEPIVLAVEWAEGDDLAATATAYVAASAPVESRIFLPSILR